MVIVFLVLMCIMLACFGLVIYLIYLGLEKDTIDYDFQFLWQDVAVTRQDMEFK